MPHLAGPVRPRQLRQHARELRVRVLRGLRERLHDDEELHGCVPKRRQQRWTNSDSARDLPVVTAASRLSPQTSTSARGTRCCAVEEAASTRREATSASAPPDTSSAPTDQPVKVSQCTRRLVEGRRGRGLCWDWFQWGGRVRLGPGSAGLCLLFVCLLSGDKWSAE